jgi:hypothetical protein
LKTLGSMPCVNLAHHCRIHNSVPPGEPDVACHHTGAGNAKWRCRPAVVFSRTP